MWMQIEIFGTINRWSIFESAHVGHDSSVLQLRNVWLPGCPPLSRTYELSSSLNRKMDGLRAQGASLKRPDQHAAASQSIALMDGSHVVSCARTLMDDSDMRECSLREQMGPKQRLCRGVRSSQAIIKNDCVFSDWKSILHLHSCKEHVFRILDAFTRSLNTHVPIFRPYRNTGRILTHADAYLLGW